MRLHREGKIHIPVMLILVGGICGVITWFLKDTSFVWLAGILNLLGFALILITFNFFRNPEIDVPTNPNHILAPCDGKVVVIEEVVDNEYFKGPMMQLSIFMSPLNVHVNRNPIAGVVSYQKYHPGKYLMAFNPKSSTENENNYVVIKNEKIEVGFRQIAGFLARRIRWYVAKGDKAEQGGEMGFIKFGSRIDVMLPVGTKIDVSLQEIVKGGRTVLATLES